MVVSTGSPRDGEQVARLDLLVEPGPVQVAATLPAYPAIRVGAIVEVGGRLQPPPDDDPYGEYLRRTGAAGSLQARRLSIVAPPDGLTLQTARDASGDALQRALPEPEGGLEAHRGPEGRARAGPVASGSLMPCQSGRLRAFRHHPAISVEVRDVWDVAGHQSGTS